MMSVNESETHNSMNGYCPESYLDEEQNSADDQQPNDSLSTVIETYVYFSSIYKFSVFYRLFMCC